tara:strand:+ start:391 stop:606 length:216 start_codon:yes stop_codon:yes gene_type:complete
MEKHMNVSEYKKIEEELRLSCECGWEGMAQEAYGELYETILDFECPKCDKMLLIVNLIVDEDKYFKGKNNK